MKKRKTILTILFIVVAVGSIYGFIYLRRYSQFGITSLGGANYWIEMATITPDVEQAKSHLTKVITHCGPNAAEVAVSNLDYPADAHRLFLLLADVAPSDNWRSRYYTLAEVYKDPYPKGDFDIYK
jgi:hypothetical protein